MGGFLPPAERRSSALLGLYAALSLLLLITGERLPTGGLRGIGAWVFAPFDRAVLAVDRIASSWRENQQLHLRVTQLEIENLRLRSAGRENQELREQLSLPAWHGQTLRPVEILALSGEPVPSGATLSAGRAHGVEVGDGVMTPEGLLGRITEVYPTLSRATLLTDLNSAVACEVESTGVLGVLHFSADPHPRLVLTGVPLADTLRIGERVVTSGLSSRFARGIPVGTVSHIGRDPTGLTQDVEVESAARLSKLRHGFIIPRPRAVEGAP